MDAAVSALVAGIRSLLQPEAVAAHAARHLLQATATATSAPAANAFETRSGLDFNEISSVQGLQESEYVQKVARPLVIGLAFGILTLVAFVIYLIVSCCCCCCNRDKRGFCQRPQTQPYLKRLPYIVPIALVALVAVIGGALVLQNAPKLPDMFTDAFKFLVLQTDVILAGLLSMKTNLELAATLTGTSTSQFSDIDGMLNEIQTIRDELETVGDNMTDLTSMMKTAAVGVGSGIMALAFVAVAGAAALQNWLLVVFLAGTFVISWLSWILFGVFTFLNILITDINVFAKDFLAGTAGNELESLARCPDTVQVASAMDAVYTSANAAVTAANTALTAVNAANAVAFSDLTTLCDEWNAPSDRTPPVLSATGTYKYLCSAPGAGETYTDSALISAVHQCYVSSTPDFEFPATAADTSTCTWYNVNYPTIDFGTPAAAVAPNCFMAATKFLDTPNQRNIQATAQRTGSAVLLADPGYVSTTLIQNHGTWCTAKLDSMGLVETITPVATSAPNVPLLCMPYSSVNGSQWQATAVCGSAVSVNSTLINAAYGGAICNDTSAATADRRKHCVTLGDALFQEEFTALNTTASAVEVYKAVAPQLLSFLNCDVIKQIIMVFAAPQVSEMNDVLKKCADGFLCAAIGLTLASLLVCSCWRKVVRPGSPCGGGRGAVAPAPQAAPKGAGKAPAQYGGDFAEP